MENKIDTTYSEYPPEYAEVSQVSSGASSSKQVNSTFSQAACYASTDLMERAFTQNNVSVSIGFDKHPCSFVYMIVGISKL